MRCTFGGRSVVPDVAVVAWSRIRFNDAGEPGNDFLAVPDWAMEILSPDQKTTRVIDNILHCLQHGCQLAWLIDPDDDSVLIFAPQQEPEICRGDSQLRVLAGMNLTLTAAKVFGWLKIRREVAE